MQVMTLLEACLIEKSETLHYSPFYSLFTAMVTRHGQHTAITSHSADENAAFDTLLRRRMNELLRQKVQDSSGDGGGEEQQEFVLKRIQRFIDCFIHAAGEETDRTAAAVETSVTSKVGSAGAPKSSRRLKP